MDRGDWANRELNAARKWLLVVGILMFVCDLVFTFVLGDASLEQGRVLIYISTGILLVFVALWWFAQYRPRLCLVLGLVVFWTIHLLAAIQDPKTIASGILIKILFTAALIKGLKSASRYVAIRKDLGEVFE